ncbi:uncharacterized protein CMU_038370 [Cryptosporidium muris RN66]|uniref:HTH La-type RNA-binding domain-containing protein n=1 Tax=Cryptosporidium muris (strain RN66) TaxID=441375 RepID=B6A980_CRYMR|nr:uncharacterized protein CMU_038370 [Cryptosporidium muris RN66]EEA04771.1 hypothetical protein, conserved [Cryptosporidium muris RN66]|eukprot:XP_002139120.1 hypothetical protein [Cryptosporidium muris RN66]
MEKITLEGREDSGNTASEEVKISLEKILSRNNILNDVLLQEKFDIKKMAISLSSILSLPRFQSLGLKYFALSNNGYADEQDLVHGILNSSDNKKQLNNINDPLLDASSSSVITEPCMNELNCNSSAIGDSNLSTLTVDIEEMTINEETRKIDEGKFMCTLVECSIASSLLDLCLCSKGVEITITKEDISKYKDILDKEHIKENCDNIYIKPTFHIERTTLILRELDPNITENNIRALLTRCPHFTDIDNNSAQVLEKYIANIRKEVHDTWFVTLVNEDLVTSVALWLRSQKLGNKLLRVGVKSEHPIGSLLSILSTHKPNTMNKISTNNINGNVNIHQNKLNQINTLNSGNNSLSHSSNNSTFHKHSPIPNPISLHNPMNLYPSQVVSPFLIINNSNMNDTCKISSSPTKDINSMSYMNTTNIIGPYTMYSGSEANITNIATLSTSPYYIQYGALGQAIPPFSATCAPGQSLPPPPPNLTDSVEDSLEDREVNFRINSVDSREINSNCIKATKGYDIPTENNEDIKDSSDKKNQLNTDTKGKSPIMHNHPIVISPPPLNPPYLTPYGTYYTAASPNIPTVIASVPQTSLFGAVPSIHCGHHPHPHHPTGHFGGPRNISNTKNNYIAKDNMTHISNANHHGRLHNRKVNYNRNNSRRISSPNNISSNTNKSNRSINSNKKIININDDNKNDSNTNKNSGSAIEVDDLLARTEKNECVTFNNRTDECNASETTNPVETVSNDKIKSNASNYTNTSPNISGKGQSFKHEDNRIHGRTVQPAYNVSGNIRNSAHKRPDSHNSNYYFQSNNIKNNKGDVNESYAYQSNFRGKPRNVGDFLNFVGGNSEVSNSANIRSYTQSDSNNAKWTPNTDHRQTTSGVIPDAGGTNSRLSKTSHGTFVEYFPSLSDALKQPKGMKNPNNEE